MGRDSSNAASAEDARPSSRPPLRDAYIHTSTKTAQRGNDTSNVGVHSARSSKVKPDKSSRSIVQTATANPVSTPDNMKAKSQSQRKVDDPISVLAAEDRTSKKRKRALSGEPTTGETAASSGQPGSASKSTEARKVSINPTFSQSLERNVVGDRNSSSVTSEKRKQKNVKSARDAGHGTTGLPNLSTDARHQNGDYIASRPSEENLTKSQRRRLKRERAEARQQRKAAGGEMGSPPSDDDLRTAAPPKTADDSSLKINALPGKSKDKEHKNRDPIEQSTARASTDNVAVTDRDVVSPSQVSREPAKKKKKKNQKAIEQDAPAVNNVQPSERVPLAGDNTQSNRANTAETQAETTRRDIGTTGGSLTKSYSAIPLPPLVHWQSTTNTDNAVEKSTETVSSRRLKKRHSKRYLVKPAVPFQRPNGTQTIEQQLQNANGRFHLIRAKNMTLKRGFPEKGELTEDELQVIDNLVNEFMDLNDFTLDQIYEIIDLPSRSIRARGFWTMIKEALSNRKTDIMKAMRPRAARGERGQLDDAEVDALREMIANDPEGNWVDRAKALNRHPTIVRNFYINYMKHQTHGKLDRGAKKWNEIETRQLREAAHKQIAMLKRAERGIALDDPAPIEITDADYLDPAYQIDSFALAGKVGNRGPLAIRKKWRKLRWYKEREVQMTAAAIKYGPFERHFEMQAVSNYQVMLPGDKVSCLKGLLVIARENAIRPVDYGPNKIYIMNSYIPGEWSLRDAYEVLFQTRKVLERKEGKLVDYLVKAIAYFDSVYTKAQLAQNYDGPIEIWVDVYNRRRRDRWIYERGAPAAMDPPPGLTIADAEAFVEKNGGQIPRPECWDMRGWSLWEGMGYSALSDPFIYGDSDEEDEDDDDVEEGVTKVRSQGKKVVLRVAPDSDQDVDVEESDDE